MIKFKKPKLTRKQMLITGVVAVLIIATGVLLFSYLNTKAELHKIKTEEQGGEEVANLVKTISKHVELPADEVPTVATVNDLGVLQDQLFFENAQVGDKVIVYPQLGRAILYRPSEKKIIEYAPVNY